VIMSLWQCISRSLANFEFIEISDLLLRVIWSPDWNKEDHMFWKCLYFLGISGMCSLCGCQDLLKPLGSLLTRRSIYSCNKEVFPVNSPGTQGKPCWCPEASVEVTFYVYVSVLEMLTPLILDFSLGRT
jgi:hypothetical protein